MNSARPRFVLAFALVAGLGGCGIAIQRDLSKTPEGQVGFDDLCGLQSYFDAIEGGQGSEPLVTSSTESEGSQGSKAVRRGRTRFAFENDFQLDELYHQLDENWRRLPPGLDTTARVELEVHWTVRGGVSRVDPDEDATLSFDGKSFDLPYHVCLSELLFGRPLYARRPEAKPVYKPIDFSKDLPAPPRPVDGAPTP